MMKKTSYFIQTLLLLTITNLLSVKGAVDADKVTTLTDITFATDTYSGYIPLSDSKRLHYVFTAS